MPETALQETYPEYTIPSPIQQVDRQTDIYFFCAITFLILWGIIGSVIFSTTMLLYFFFLTLHHGGRKKKRKGNGIISNFDYKYNICKQKFNRHQCKILIHPYSTPYLLPNPFYLPLLSHRFLYPKKIFTHTH